MQQSNTVIVTGGAGFIGSHIVESLLKSHYQVIVYDNFLSGRAENLDSVYKYIEVINGDIRDYDHFSYHAQRSIGIIHQAALVNVEESVAHPELTFDININGFLNILRAAKKFNHKKVVYASSASVYNDTTVVPNIEGQEATANSPYSLSKEVNEKYALLFDTMYNVPTVGLRYFNAYGPRQLVDSMYGSVIPNFIDALLNNQTPVIYGSGEQYRDFIYVKDIARANILAFESDLRSTVINIGSGEKTSINKLFSTLSYLLKVTPKVLIKNDRQGDIFESLASTTRAQSVLKFKSSISLEKGLDYSINYYKGITNEVI